MSELTAIKFAEELMGKGLRGIRMEHDQIVVENVPITQQISALGQNKDENRSSNISCFDKTHVQLQSGRYIHANYVSGHERPNEFICTQAPMFQFLEDFWDMNEVIEVGVGKKVECIFVQMKNIDKHVLRASYLRLQTPDGAMSLVHLQHTTWLDRCAPPSAQPVPDILNMLDKFAELGERVNSFPPPSGITTKLIHCTAGIGRDGTVVCLHIGLKAILAGEPLNVSEIVRKVRKERHRSVQTHQQYVFLYIVFARLFEKFYSALRFDLSEMEEFVHSTSKSNSL